MDEYDRLYKLYMQKDNSELMEIIISKNDYTEIAVEVASDILKHDRGQELQDIPKCNTQSLKKNSQIENTIRNFFSFLRKKQPLTEQPQLSVKIDYNNSESPYTQFKEQTGIDLGIEYAMLSTAGDNNVCPMCAQFEGKIFLSTDAPPLPLCPSCSCAYMYYLKDDLPSNAVISNKNDFALPAKCTPLFYKHHQELYEERDISNQIKLCESDLANLSEFMKPYITANFPAPQELLCRDLLPDLYMQLGKWDKAEQTIKKCIDANAYFPDDGAEELKYLISYKKVATETLSYIQQNPGCLQRNIYKKMRYEEEEREVLKDFLRYTKLIKKVKYNNTNQLFCITEEPTKS